MKSSSQERQHVLIIPGSLLATRPHTDLGCSAVTDAVDGDLAQDSQVARSRPIPDAAVIFPEGDIQDPMEPILYGPMPADCLDQDLGVIAAAGQEIADLRFDRAGAVDPADGFHCQHGPQPGPSAQRFQTGGLRADEHTPADQAAMAVVKGIEDRPARGAAGETVLLTTPPARPKRRALIGLEDQQIIGVPFQDPAGDRLLAAHGIQRHDAVLHGQRLEQRRDRGDLGRLAIDLTLAEPQALLAGPGADQVQRPLAAAPGSGPWQRPLRPTAVKGAAQRLAVDRTTSRWTTAAKDWAQALKQASKASGSIGMKTRRKVSCEGMPWARVKKDCSQPSLLRP